MPRSTALSGYDPVEDPNGGFQRGRLFHQLFASESLSLDSEVGIVLWRCVHPHFLEKGRIQHLPFPLKGIPGAVCKIVPRLPFPLFQRGKPSLFPTSESRLRRRAGRHPLRRLDIVSVIPLVGGGVSFLLSSGGSSPGRRTSRGRAARTLSCRDRMADLLSMCICGPLHADSPNRS